jgi:hypothetical protein
MPACLPAVWVLACVLTFQLLLPRPLAACLPACCACREEGGDAKEFLLKHINSWVCRVSCHKVVKLSDAVQPLPRQTTEFVHGVAESFLNVGQAKAEPAPEGGKR